MSITMADFETPIRVTHNNTTIIELRFHDGAAQIRAGKGAPGLLELFNSNNRGVMAFEAESGIVRVGQEGTAGEIRVVDANKVRTIVLDGEKGEITLKDFKITAELFARITAQMTSLQNQILSLEARIRFLEHPLP
jgi:hypothetical protein